MKKLLRTLYILTPDSYLYWRNENVCIKVGGTEKVAIPALTLDAIVCFGQMTVSTPGARDQRHVPQQKRAVSGAFLRAGQRECIAEKAPV